MVTLKKMPVAVLATAVAMATGANAQYQDMQGMIGGIRGQEKFEKNPQELIRLREEFRRINRDTAQMVATGGAQADSTKISHVTKLTTATHDAWLESKVFDPDEKNGDVGGLVMVKYATKWCSFCKKIKPIWESLADKVDLYHFPTSLINDPNGQTKETLSVYVASVDCEEEPDLPKRAMALFTKTETSWLSSLGNKIGIFSYPTIVMYYSNDLYPEESGKTRKDVMQAMRYYGGRRIVPMLNWLSMKAGRWPEITQTGNEEEDQKTFKNIQGCPVLEAIKAQAQADEEAMTGQKGGARFRDANGASDPSQRPSNYDELVAAGELEGIAGDDNTIGMGYAERLVGAIEGATGANMGMGKGSTQQRVET